MIYLIYETLNFCDRVPLDIYASLGKSSLYNKETFPFTFILLIDDWWGKCFPAAGTNISQIIGESLSASGKLSQEVLVWGEKQVQGRVLDVHFLKKI